MGFKQWSKGYNELQETLQEVCGNEDLIDILLFNEVIKHELMTEMKKVSDKGFLKKDIKNFKKYLEQFKLIVNDENN